MPLAPRGQGSYGHRADMHRYGGRLHSTGNGEWPVIDIAPGAFGSGRRAMRLQADPNGTPSSSRSGKAAFGGGFENLQSVFTDEFEILLETADGDTIWYQLVRSSHGSQSPFLEIGQRGAGNTVLRLVDSQTWAQGWTFDTSLSANTVHKVRVIYESNERIRVWLDGEEVLNETHSSDREVRNRWFGCIVEDGDALAEVELSYWVARNWWDATAAITPTDSADEWIHVPAIPRVPGDIGDGVHGISMFYHFDIGIYGDGGDDTALLAIFQLSEDDSFTSFTSDPVPISGDNGWNAVGKLPATPGEEYWHRVVVFDGSFNVVSTSTPRKFLMPSRPGSAPVDFKWLIGGDTGESATHPPYIVFEQASTQGVNGFIHLGDITYADQNQQDLPNSSTADDFRMRYEMMMGSREWFMAMSQWINLFMWDGHEVQANYHITTPPSSLDAAEEAFRDYFSDAVLNRGPANTGATEDNTHYHHVDTGDVRIIMMDTRRFRSQNGPARLGDNQKAWLESLLANNTRPAVWLISPNPMSRAVQLDGNPEPTGYNRGWYSNYVAERDDLWDAFSNGNDAIQAKLMIFSADLHAQSWGKPDHDDPNIAIECISAPLAQGYTSSKMVWYVEEFFDAEGLSGAQQLGTLAEVDETNHTIKLSAYNYRTDEQMYEHEPIQLATTLESRIFASANWTLAALSSQGITHDANKISAWGTMTQSSGALQPDRVPNGLPSARDAVAFDGDARLIIPENVLSEGDKTIFLILRLDSVSAVPRAVSFLYGDSLRTEIFYRDATSNLQFISDGIGNHTGRAVPHTAGDLIVLGVRDDDGTITMTVNGTTISHTSGNSAAAGTLTASHLGARASGGERWNGLISAVLAAPEALSNETMDEVSDLLREFIYVSMLPAACVSDADSGVIVESSTGFRKPIMTMTHPGGAFSINFNPGASPMVVYVTPPSDSEVELSEGTDFDTLLELIKELVGLGFEIEGIHAPFTGDDTPSEIVTRQSLATSEFTFMSNQECSLATGSSRMDIARKIALGII